MFGIMIKHGKKLFFCDVQEIQNSIFTENEEGQLLLLATDQLCRIKFVFSYIFQNQENINIQNHTCEPMYKIISLVTRSYEKLKRI